MNKKAETFKSYLDEQKIEGVFKVEELEDDFDTVIYRSQLDINGNKLPTAVIFDKSVYGMIRLLVAPKVMTEKNQLEVLRLIDSYNRRYKAIKYYIDEAGSLILDVCLISSDEEESVGEMVYAMFDVIIRHLNEAYKDIMHSIWA